MARQLISFIRGCSDVTVVISDDGRIVERHFPKNRSDREILAAAISRETVSGGTEAVPQSDAAAQPEARPEAAGMTKMRIIPTNHVPEKPKEPGKPKNKAELMIDALEKAGIKDFERNNFLKIRSAYLTAVRDGKIATDAADSQN